MTKPFTEWTVLPHGKLTHLDDNILTVTGMLDMPPMGHVSRRMTVVRLSDERLVIYSAIALDESQMDVLLRFGKPAFLIVPNDLHRLDVRAWKDRFPSITVVAPAGARKKVQDVVPVDASTIDFGDSSVRFTTVMGTGDREAALLIETSGGTTIVLNDLIFDLANRQGLRGWLFKAIGMTGDEPHITAPVKMREVKDEGALRAQLEQWSRLPHLKQVVISHGDVIATEPARVLERIASHLAS